MVRDIKKIIKESIQENVINKMINLLNYGTIKPPYYFNLNNLGFSNDEIKIILGKFFNGIVEIVEVGTHNFIQVKHKKCGVDRGLTRDIYYEDIESEFVESHWSLNIMNKNCGITFHDNDEGEWYIQEFDENGNVVYYENHLGRWYKYEYDEMGNEIYFENSGDYWVKSEYDKRGNQIYRETSDDGVILDKR